MRGWSESVLLTRAKASFLSCLGILVPVFYFYFYFFLFFLFFWKKFKRSNNQRCVHEKVELRGRIEKEKDSKDQIDGFTRIDLQIRLHATYLSTVPKPSQVPIPSICVWTRHARSFPFWLTARVSVLVGPRYGYFSIVATLPRNCLLYTLSDLVLAAAIPHD